MSKHFRPSYAAEHKPHISKTGPTTIRGHSKFWRVEYLPGWSWDDLNTVERQLQIKAYDFAARLNNQLSNEFQKARQQP